MKQIDWLSRLLDIIPVSGRMEVSRSAIAVSDQSMKRNSGSSH
jgi:hypothetical protein